MPTRGLLIVLLLLVLASGVGVTRVVFSRIPVDSIVDQRYAEAVARDPAHAALYAAAYAAYGRVTGSDALHYTVHRVAERAAEATGHTAAARTQAARADEHDPPQAGWAYALRRVWHVVQRIASP